MIEVFELVAKLLDRVTGDLDLTEEAKRDRTVGLNDEIAVDVGVADRLDLNFVANVELVRLCGFFARKAVQALKLVVDAEAVDRHVGEPFVSHVFAGTVGAKRNGSVRNIARRAVSARRARVSVSAEMNDGRRTAMCADSSPSRRMAADAMIARMICAGAKRFAVRRERLLARAGRLNQNTRMQARRLHHNWRLHQNSLSSVASNVSVGLALGTGPGKPGRRTGGQPWRRGW